MALPPTQAIPEIINQNFAPGGADSHGRSIRIKVDTGAGKLQLKVEHGLARFGVVANQFLKKLQKYFEFCRVKATDSL